MLNEFIQYDTPNIKFENDERLKEFVVTIWRENSGDNGEVDGGPDLNSSVSTDEFKNNGASREICILHFLQIAILPIMIGELKSLFPKWK